MRVLAAAVLTMESLLMGFALLIAKGIIRADEWEDIRPFFKYDYIEDNHFSELKDAEILTQRLQALQTIDPYVGKYYSQTWVKKNILRLDEDQVEQIEKEIEQEAELQMAQAEKEGMLTGVQNTAMNNYVAQNSMQQEQPAEDQSEVNAEQTNEEQPAKVTKLKTGTWPN